MASQKKYSVEWVDDPDKKEIQVIIEGDKMLIRKQKNNPQNIQISVTDYDLVEKLEIGGCTLFPEKVPEDTVVFLHTNPTCSFIPTPTGWVRWCRQRGD